jgi:hypothetical protein
MADFRRSVRKRQLNLRFTIYDLRAGGRIAYYVLRGKPACRPLIHKRFDHFVLGFTLAAQYS